MTSEQLKNLNSGQITNALLYNQYTATELQVIRQAWIEAHKKLQNNQKRQFRIGNQVSFTSSRTGEYVQGVVTKINPKTIQVLTTSGTRWKVSPSLLTKVG